MGRARDAGAAAPHRRAREGRRQRPDLLRGANHELMTELRAAKVEGIADESRRSRSTPSPSAAARARLGIDRGHDPRGGAPRAPGGSSVARAHLTHLNPLPANTGEVLAVLRARARPRAEQRAAGDRTARSLPGRRRELRGAGRAAVQRPRSSMRSLERHNDRPRTSRRRDRDEGARATLTKADFQSSEETRWCPGCGDYAVLVGGAGVHARARNPAGADRVHHRDRLRGAILLLHGHLRDARHPRPRAGDRHRLGVDARGPVDLGRLRRRRLRSRSAATI